MVREIYDPKNDTLFVRLAEGEIAESEEVRPNVIFDFDKDGKLLAIQFLSASENVAENPKLAALQVA